MEVPARLLFRDWATVFKRDSVMVLGNSKKWSLSMKIGASFLCLTLIIWAINAAGGRSVFFDLSSAVFVLGGGLLYAIARSGSFRNYQSLMVHFSFGAVYFGWIGLLIGLIRVVEGLKETNYQALNITVILLPILYAYIIRWILPVALEGEE